MTDFDDDSLLLEALENVEKTEVQESSFLSTPPDSEIIKNFREKENISVIEDKGLDFASEKCNFRSKLMESLLNNRNTCGQVPQSTFKSLSGDKKNVKRKSIESEHEVNESLSKIIKTSSELFQDYDKETQIQGENFVLYSLNDSYIQTPNLGTDSHKDLPLVVDSPVGSLTRKRKFPGPAGLLPQWGHQTSAKANVHQERNKEADFQRTKDSVCSQASAQDFASGPWKQMLFDLTKTEGSFQQLLKENTIQWILRRANLKGPASIRKIAFIVVMIQSIDLSHVDAPAVFADETGEINGTISNGVLEQYSNCISNGTVLVLRDVTILSPALFQSGRKMIAQLKRHYLNITLNSLVSIYYADDEESVRKVEVIKLCKELVQSLLDSEGKRERKEVAETEENLITDEVSLFSNFSIQKDCAPQVISNVCSLPSFKPPLALSENSPNLVRNVGQPSPQNLKNSLPKFSKPNQQHHTAHTSHSFPKSISFTKSKLQHQFESCNSENFGHKQQSRRTSSALPEKGKSKTTPASSKPKTILDSFGDDDDELDSLLASIDTESL